MTRIDHHRRSPDGLPVLLPLDAESGEPLFRQLYRLLRDAILDGRLVPGLRLPSTRVLAGDVGVSRNTVVTAFELLHAEGYLESRVGRGTRVVEALPEYFRRATPRKLALPVTRAQPASTSRRSAALARAAGTKSLLDDPAPAFRPGLPALELFPLHLWQRTMAHQARVLGPEVLGYSNVRGFLPLRRAIAQYLSAARGMSCMAEQVFVVAGTQEALQLSAEVAIDPGDEVWVEDPGYQGAVGALVAAGARVVGVPVDGEGLDVEAARARAPHARLAYVTPSHQFPLGSTLSLGRRLKLLEWARTAGAWIVEDDYDSEYRYVSRPLTSLAGLDGIERVIYCGSFSKVLFPAMRLGYVVVPSHLVDAFAAARRFADIHRATFDQMVLAAFIDEGHFERHVRRMRVLYRERRDALLDGLATAFGDEVTLSGADAGMHLVLWLAPGIDAHDVQRRAAARGIDAIPVSAFSIEGVTAPGLVLGYAHLDSVRIRRACRELAVAVSSASRLQA